MQYHIEIEEKALKKLSKLPLKEQARISEKIEALSKEPMPIDCKKLKGIKNSYRIRSGSYRIIYNINNNVLTILIVDLGHRKEIYQGIN